MEKQLAFVALLVGVALAGACGNPTPLSCSCPAGMHCDANQACVPDSASPPDLSMVLGPDLAVAGCNPPCAGKTHCNATKHCVVCVSDDDCPAGNVCKVVSDQISTCVPGCNDDAHCKTVGPMGVCCGMACIDAATDPSNCGACGKTCSAPNAVVTCTAGVCATGACNAGWGDCNGDPRDGCEANLRVDPNNCKSCKSACKFDNARAGCSDACYLAACNFGFDDCDGDPKNGCEKSILSDPKNCGKCGMPCGAPAHATVVCQNAQCVLTGCAQGWSDCDGNAANGCETNSFTDAMNCGGCGAVCGQNLLCANGGCTCVNCTIPNSKTACVNQMCQFVSCLGGFADCNNNTKDGCEVNTNTDPKNCGGCGTVCPMGTPYCLAGVCTKGVDYGPVHTFIGQMSDFFLSTGQGCCSVNCAGNAAVDAAYFCQHFYATPNNMTCTVTTVGTQVQQGGWMMHKNGGCTSQGTDIPNTACDTGACKMWNSGQAYSGLKGIICHCN